MHASGLRRFICELRIARVMPISRTSHIAIIKTEIFNALVSVVVFFAFGFFICRRLRGVGAADNILETAFFLVE